jgi:glycerol-3-phosphate dehydrogenase (NAD(P)+)
MNSKNSSEKPVGVLGAGNFGSAIASLMAQHRPVLMYARQAAVADEINRTQAWRGHPFYGNVQATTHLPGLAHQCDVIFPVVPSQHFREVMRQLSPHLHPYHILIHGAKGLDIALPPGESLDTAEKISRAHVKTMSEVIREETVVVRVGCISGPNLSKELSQQQPGATVIASPFQEVTHTGKKLLRNERFQVYENDDLIGVELAGVLKNIIAIAAGALSGLGYGENAKGLLISRGAVEMIHLGRALGGNIKAFLGVAGIGDLVATCNSPLSRNYTVGFRLAKGEKLSDILSDMKEVAEGINTIKIARKCASYYKVRALITDNLYRVLFGNLTMEKAAHYLMRYPLNVDIDFL